jgi:hypothetical protein
MQASYTQLQFLAIVSEAEAYSRILSAKSVIGRRKCYQLLYIYRPDSVNRLALGNFKSLIFKLRSQ